MSNFKKRTSKNLFSCSARHLICYPKFPILLLWHDTILFIYLAINKDFVINL